MVKLGGMHVGDNVDRWDKYLKEFEAIKKKELLSPRDPYYLALNKAKKVFSEGLGEVDAMYEMVMSACGGRNGLDISAAPTALKGYGNKLVAAKTKRPDVAIKALLDVSPKDTKPMTYRACKMLLQSVDSVVASMEQEMKTLVNQVKNAGKESSRETNIADTNRIALGSVKKAVAKSLTEIQKCRANPTLAGWAKLFSNGGTRDLVLAVQSLERAQKGGDFDQVPSATPFRHQTDLYNPGGKLAEFPQGSTDDMVPHRLKSWSQIVKWVNDGYAPYW